MLSSTRGAVPRHGLSRPGATRAAPPSPFAGFWMGGFEGADHVNGDGHALDMARASGHIDRLEEDHRRAAQAGLRCVRESIGWRLAEDGEGRIDLARALAIQASAHRHGLQVLWTLMHYGLPPGLSLHDDAMVPRLARFAGEVARVLGPRERRAPVFTPINEIGFLAWGATQPGLFHPPDNSHGHDLQAALRRGWEVKCRLVRAALAAMKAMRAAWPASRFMHVEPVVHVAAPFHRAELAQEAAEVSGWQWQACDMLAGLAEPELGGDPGWLDVVGVNHYESSQWELTSGARLEWATRDPRRLRLGELLATTWRRYRRPLVLAETGHVGVGRADWLHEVAAEARQVLRAGIPLQGLCMYPLCDRPDWDHPTHWHRSGLWHVETGSALQRCGEHEALAALKAWQRVLPHGLQAAGSAAAAPRAPAATARPARLPGRAPAPLSAPGTGPVVVAFSHLRWELMRHRARHLFERLAQSAAGWRVVFVEEPLPAAEPRLDCIARGPRTQVLVPHAPLTSGGFEGPQLAAMAPLLRAWLDRHGMHQPAVWLSTPMAWPLAQTLQPSRVVYDCADELSGFAFAPPGLAEREQQLLAAADVVCVTGPTLAAPRRAAAGSRLRLLPNGVDTRRFARRVHAEPAGWDAEEAAAVAAPLWASGGPQLGYAGAIDERVDLCLLAELADARPGWQFVLAGPVLKIDAASLPRRPNLHWLGEVPYRLLPSLMGHWALALLPFVHSEATRGAQPLKVLEALAAGLPVVAPALAELQPFAAAGVQLLPVPAHGGRVCPRAFVDACERALTENTAARLQRRTMAARLLKTRSWHRAAQGLAAALQVGPAKAPVRGAVRQDAPARERHPTCTS